MSTDLAEPVADAARSETDRELRTYRGRTLEQLLPQIREELGPHAIVVRQRDGLMGGVAGFFQQRFVEVEARPGHPRVDVYDEPLVPEDFARQLAEAEEQAEPVVIATPFAATLPSAARDSSAPSASLDPPAPDPSPDTPLPALPTAVAAGFADALPVAGAASQPTRPMPAPSAARPPAAPSAKRAPAKPAPAKRTPAKRAPAAPRPARQAASRRSAVHAASPRSERPSARARELTTALTRRGLSDDVAAALVADALAHELPFLAHGGARDATAAALARRIPIAPPPRGDGRTVAFVGAGGAGKTHCVAALAAAYARAGTSPVLCLALAPQDDGAELRRLLEPHGVEVHAVATPAAARTRLRRAPAGALVVLDTPAASPGDARAVRALATKLASIEPRETQLVVPATLGAGAAGELCERLAPLAPSAIALTHADATDHLGAVVELACTMGLPLSFVVRGGDLPGALAPADSRELAERLLR